MLERFARDRGMTDPDGLADLRDAAERAHDERAGLRGARGFEQARDFTSSRITLVDDAELEFSLELERFTRDVKEATEAGLAQLHLRYLTLLEPEDGNISETPVGPEAVCTALNALLESHVLSPAERISLLESWRGDLTAELKAFYRELDQKLAAADIKPKALKAITKASPVPATAPASSKTQASMELDALQRALSSRGAPPASAEPGQNNVDAGTVLAQLREWMLANARQSIDAPLAVLSSDLFRMLAPDTATGVEMIERIFERISADPAVPETLSKLLWGLRLPLVDRALEGDDLLRSPARTVERIVDGVAAIADTLPSDASASHPAVRSIEGIFAELLATHPLRHDTLAKAAIAVEAVHERRINLLHAGSEGAEQLAGKAERREAARLLASRALHVLLDGLQPGAVRRFLAQHWIHVLTNTLYRKGDKHPDWRAQLVTANDISLIGRSPDGTVDDLEHRVISTLRATLRDDGAFAAARKAFLLALEAPAATGPDTETAQEEATLTLSAASGNDRLLLLHHKGFTDAHVSNEAELMPELGAWMDLALPSGETLTGQMCWLGSLKQTGLICAVDDGRCVIMTRRAFAALGAASNFRLRKASGLFARATRQALAACQP